MLLDIKDKVGDEYGKQYKGEYVYKSISWGKQNSITERCTVFLSSGGSKINLKRLQAMLVLATLRQSPKVITLSHLMDESDNGLPVGLGSRIMKLVDQVNGLQSEEVKNLDEQ